MTTLRDIRCLAQHIAREFKPRRIILFGSHAYGKPDDDSDVDLLVLMPYQGHAARLAGEILLETDPVFPVDIMVRSPDEVRKRYRRGDAFTREIIDRGRVLYEA